MELSQENLQAAESIFHRTLLKIPSLELWKQYLDYLRRIHPLIPDPDGNKRAIISQAFDILLDNVGIDPDSGDLWREYIEFIKSMPGVVGGQGWQDAQKVDLLRKAYQRAVRFPHSELTKLWKEYDNFEIGLNKQNARKFLQEHSPYYMTARTARTQLDQQINGLDRKSLPILPPLYGCYGEDAFATQVEKWRAWVEWEKRDELVLKDEDIDAFRKRILFVYRQATIFLRFYPEIWFQASAWCFEQGTEEMEKLGEEFLTNGIEACPESVLLTLKKADRMEIGLEPGSTDEIAVRNGELLDPIYEGLLKALYALHKKLVERMNKSVGEVREYFASLPSEDDEALNSQEDRDDDDDSQIEKPLSRTQKMEEQIKSIRTAALEQQDTLKRTISYVWVAKLRAFRRIQGQGQPGKAKKGFRGVFAEARPRGQLTSEVYIANALMEWRCYQDRSADKIFERGLKLFPIDEIFALEYIKHLISNNDDTNARAVFETTMTKIANTSTISEQQKKEKSRPLLGYMHSVESNYGDLDKIHKIERRLREMFPSEPDFTRFASRFALPSFDALAVQLVISPTQARPKIGVGVPESGVVPVPSIEEPGRSPPGPSRLELGPHGPYVASPKRGLEDSDNETPARKFMRAESPLKGAAGRRIQSQSQAGGPAPPGSSGGGGFVTKTYVPGQAGPPGGGSQAPPHPAALPWEIHGLLNKLPNARYYTQHLFDPAKMLNLLNSTNLANARL
jgi:cleavage stimulation factor subunit 3